MHTQYIYTSTKKKLVFWVMPIPIPILPILSDTIPIPILPILFGYYDA